MYIVFEGIVGTGKSTQSKKLAEYLKERYKGRKVLLTREPGGTEIADAIRNVVQGMEFKEEMEHICEAYLYAASRAQSLRKVVKPVLDKGGFVVADRSFLSSLTNQAFGRELGFGKVYSINKQAIEEVMPDVVIYLDYDIDKGMERSFDKKGDKFERMGRDVYKSFYDRVSKGYEFASEHPDFSDLWITIDATGTVDEVFENVLKELEPCFTKYLYSL